MSIQDLRGTKSAKAQTLAAMVNKPGAWTSEDQSVYDAGMAEIDALASQIERINAVNALAVNDALTHQVADASARHAHDAGQDAKAVYAKWLRGGDAALTNADWSGIRNTMSTSTNSEGGFTVQTDVANSILDALKAYGGMRATSTILQTSQGNPLAFPASDGTSEVGEIIAQNTTATAADPVFTQIGLPVYKYSSKIVAVPFELLQDSNVDIEAFIRGRLATRLGRITNTHYTTGTGTSQPNGIVTAAGTGVTAANSTSQVSAILYDSLIDLVHSVDPAYRAQGNCSFMMNDASIKVIRKIKDTAGRPIFTPGYESTQGGAPFTAPDQLLGYGVTVNQDMAVMAASAKSILFGALGEYTIRDVLGMEMFRFTDSAYTKLGQVGFLAWMRTGGNLIDNGGAVKLFVNAAS
jgi:HK97 family phage major capsid protein